MTPSTRNSPSGGSESSFSPKQDGAPAFPARALAGPVSLSLSPRTQREQRRRPRQGLASRRLRDSAPPRRPVVLAAATTEVEELERLGVDPVDRDDAAVVAPRTRAAAHPSQLLSRSTPGSCLSGWPWLRRASCSRPRSRVRRDALGHCDVSPGAETTCRRPSSEGKAPRPTSGRGEVLGRQLRPGGR